MKESYIKLVKLTKEVVDSLAEELRITELPICEELMRDEESFKNRQRIKRIKDKATVAYHQALLIRNDKND